MAGSASKILALPGQDDIRRILVMKWSAIGDVVIASAMFEDIFRAFPGREIDLNTMPPCDGFFECDPRFQQVLSVDLRKSERGPRGVYRWLRCVRAGRYDLIIDLQSNDRSRLLLALLQLSGAGVRYRLGNHARFPYNFAPAELPLRIHAFDRLRETLRAGGLPALTARPVLHSGPRSRQRARELMADNGLVSGRYVVFMPGCEARGSIKRWGAENYIALAIHMRQLCWVDKIAVIGASDEAQECEQIFRACGTMVANLCCRTELLDIIAIVEGARCVVSNDTGTAHLASAAARPMVVVCGPTDPRRVKPVGDNAAALQAAIYCVNCYRKTCSHHSCMALITPEMVIARLEQLGVGALDMSPTA